MFCGYETLGLGEATQGLVELPSDAPIGSDLREYLALDDQTIEVELTPNRGDCLSIRGIAREAAIANDCNIKIKKIIEIAPVIQDKVEVKILTPAACPRYLVRVIRDINSQATTPIWIKEALRRSGIRSIHPVVDITNYVMLELGQPMHAFDHAKIEQGLEVRFAKNHEKLQLLNGQEVELSKETLVIADGHQPLAIAGIMGGVLSSVTETTTAIVLESAFFEPIALMGKARHYGLHTDSSHRFERGVDAELPHQAMHRASELLLEIVGGKAGPVIEQVSEQHLPEHLPIILRRERIATLLGCAIDDKKIESIFNKLGMKVEANSNGWQITSPSYRFDVCIEVDLIEELARVYGYDNIPTRLPTAALQIQADQPNYRFADLLRALDYHEAITYSFVSPKLLSLLTPDIKSLVLDNPISPELSGMRTTLWAGLLPAVQYNVNRQQSRVRLFETGLRFVPSEKSLQQIPTLAGLVLGSVRPEQWGDKARNVDFYDLKADVEAVLALTGQNFSFHPAQHSALHPGRCAKILCNNREVGLIGALHPQIQQQLDLPAVYLFELNLVELEALMAKPQYSVVSKFPAVRRDIAIVVADEIRVGDICNTIRKEAGNLLNELIIFDVYKGENITRGQKSVALGLVWQAVDRTLSDDEINTSIQNILAELKDKYHATLRE